MVGADAVAGESPDGALLLGGVISGMVVRGGNPVDVVSSADREALVIRLVVSISERAESVRTGEVVESEGGVTGSEIDTSESVLEPGIVGLLVLVLLVGLEVLLVALGMTVSGTVEAGFVRVSPVSSAGPPDGAVSNVGPTVLLKSGNASEPVVLTVLLAAVKTVVPVSTVVAVDSTPA